MRHSAMQLLVGLGFVFLGSSVYVQGGGAGSLSMIVIGAVLATVGGVAMGVRQVLRDESKRREAESKPVLDL